MKPINATQTTIKYSQAFHLKRQVDVAIEKLTKTVAGPGATDVAHMRLAITHVSGISHLIIAYAY